MWTENIVNPNKQKTVFYYVRTYIQLHNIHTCTYMYVVCVSDLTLYSRLFQKLFCCSATISVTFGIILKWLFSFRCVYFMHFDCIVQLNEDQIFFTAKMKVIHAHASKLASSRFEVLVVIFQLLPVRANHVKTSTFCCYASILRDTLPSTLRASFPLRT